jgi:hypothetical protein
MPNRVRAAAVAAVLGALCACSGGGSTAASGTGSRSTGATSTGTEPGRSSSTSTDSLQITPPPSSGSPSTPTPVADPCALIPTAKLLSEFHTDATSSRVDAEKQTLSSGQGCIYDLTGSVDVEVVLNLVSAAQVDTSSGGGLSIAGHAAAYRQTEGGAAEIDVVVSATDAFTLSVNIGGGTTSPDSERPQAEDLATAVAGVYH